MQLDGVMSSRWRTWCDTAPRDMVHAAVRRLCEHLQPRVMLHRRINERARLHRLRAYHWERHSGRLVYLEAPGFQPVQTYSVEDYRRTFDAGHTE